MKIANHLILFNLSHEDMSSHIRKKIEAMSEDARTELLRFAERPFREKADERVWPGFLIREYRTVLARLKVAKRRFRLGLANKSLVDCHQAQLGSIRANAREYWVEAQQLLPPTIPRRQSPTPKGRPKISIKDPRYGSAVCGADSAKDGVSPIDRRRGVAGILRRTRQLEQLNIAAPTLPDLISQFVDAELKILSGEAFGLGIQCITSDSFWALEPADIEEWPDANAHVILWRRCRQRQKLHNPYTAANAHVVQWKKHLKVQASGAQPNLAEGPEVDAHVAAWRRQYVHSEKLFRSNRTSSLISYGDRHEGWKRRSNLVHSRRLSVSEYEEQKQAKAQEDAELGARVTAKAKSFRKFLLQHEVASVRPEEDNEDQQSHDRCSSCPDRLCSAVSSSWQAWSSPRGAVATSRNVISLAPSALTDNTPSERVGFLIYYHPNRRRK